MQKHILKISPKFDSRKLENVTFDALVDVYEDRVSGWLLDWAHELNKHEHAGFAVLQIGLAYFEGFAVFYYGEDSDGNAKEFFKRGFRLVFQEELNKHSTQTAEDILERLYKFGRCGLFHLGMVRSGIFLEDGEYEFKVGFDDAGKVVAIYFDRYGFVKTVAASFAQYVQRLRDPLEQELRKKFVFAWELVHKN
jgi:hypothetical protein